MIWHVVSVGSQALSVAGTLRVEVLRHHEKPLPITRPSVIVVESSPEDIAWAALLMWLPIVSRFAADPVFHWWRLGQPYNCVVQAMRLGVRFRQPLGVLESSRIGVDPARIWAAARLLHGAGTR